MPVLRHMGELRRARLARHRSGKRLAVEQDLARRRRPDAGDRLEQFALAVAGDAGDADDLAGAHAEGHVVDPRRRRARRCTARFLTSSTVRSGLALGLCRPAAARGGRPSARRARSGEVFAVSTVATISPRRITETRSVTAMISLSLWVMRMMVLPCALSCRSMREQMLGLGWASARRSARRG